MKFFIDVAILAYFLALNASYALFMFLSLFELYRTRAIRMPELDSLTLALSSTPPISILAPAFNEEATIVQSVRAFLQIRYPSFQVIVINDGSTDGTLDILKKRFDLRPVNMVYRNQIPTKPVKTIYRSPLESRLWVIDKDNGGKADALNVGLNISRTPLVCCVDADSIIDKNSMLRLAEPFIYHSDNVVAVGGTIRLANGSSVKDGVVQTIGMPQSWLARFQIVEYLRAFLFARLGFNRLGGNLIISGALGLFSRDVMVEVGGYAHDTVGEDMEIVVRLHRLMGKKKAPYKVMFIPDPVCFTEAPETLTILNRQRDRWQRGLVDTMWRHRAMICNPKYGKVGLLVTPIFLFFEMLGPAIELFGYGWFLVAILSGRVDFQVAILFFIVAFLIGFLLSLQALILDDISFNLYKGFRQRLKLILAALVENFGYRQLILMFRLKGMVKFALGVKTWGNMKRTGFQMTPPLEQPLESADTGPLKPAHSVLSQAGNTSGVSNR